MKSAEQIKRYRHIKKDLKKFVKNYLRLEKELQNVDLLGDALFRFANWFFENRQVLLEGSKKLPTGEKIRWIDYNKRKNIFTIKLDNDKPYDLQKMNLKIYFNEDHNLKCVSFVTSENDASYTHTLTKIEESEYAEYLIRSTISFFVKKYYSIFREEFYYD